jgi:hypothetical protein
MFTLSPNVFCGASIVNFYSKKVTDPKYSDLNTLLFKKIGSDNSDTQMFSILQQNTQSTKGLYEVSYYVFMKDHTTINANYTV